MIGASSIDGDGAVLDYDAREVSVARAILKNARTKVLVADASKFNRTASVRICDIGDFDIFVTDQTPSEEFLRAAEAGETRVVIAETQKGDVRGTV